MSAVSSCLFCPKSQESSILKTLHRWQTSCICELYAPFMIQLEATGILSAAPSIASETLHSLLGKFTFMLSNPRIWWMP